MHAFLECILKERGDKGSKDFEELYLFRAHAILPTLGGKSKYVFLPIHMTVLGIGYVNSKAGRRDKQPQWGKKETVTGKQMESEMHFLQCAAHSIVGK